MKLVSRGIGMLDDFDPAAALMIDYLTGESACP